MHIAPRVDFTGAGEVGGQWPSRVIPARRTKVARQMAAIVRRDEPDGVWRCRYCRIALPQVDQPWVDSGGPYSHRDHVVPLARGGTDLLPNLALCCSDCNVRKGDRLLAELPANWWARPEARA